LYISVVLWGKGGNVTSAEWQVTQISLLFISRSWMLCSIAGFLGWTIAGYPEHWSTI